jgi:TolB-like protein/Tfp pilus assembly protein PilF
MTDTPTERAAESTWTRLRRRKVVQWGLVYVAGAWGFLQGLEYVSESFHWPAQLRQIALLVLLIGLSVILVLAWYHGDRGEQRVGGTELVIITLLFLLGGGVFWLYERGDETPTVADRVDVAPAPVVAAAKSIAVLPFVNMSGDVGNEYFAEGLSEELINLLVKIPELRVAARTSAFKFKGEKINAQDAAQKLNVAHVLEGSVRKSGNKVRITAQLVKASDGYHLWSETYDRTLDDIFIVQDEIAGAVVKALQVTLLGTPLATRSKPQDPEAYNLALQGRYFLERRDQGDFERAIDYFRRSRERDPAYAPAWAGLSKAYARQADNGLVPVAEGYRRAREAAEKALALDPQLVDAHLAMGWIHMVYDWDWAAADASVRRALELEPGNVKVLRAFAVQADTFGRWDEAMDAVNKAIERDPLVPDSYFSLGLTLRAVNRDREAETAFRKAFELNPGAAFGHLAIGRQLLLQGETEGALREIQQEKDEYWRLSGLPLAYHAFGQRRESDAALAAFKSKYGAEGAYQIAEMHAFRGEADLAFEWLERAYAQRDPGVTEIKGDRLFRTLIDDPRYKAFLKKMKLPE